MTSNMLRNWVRRLGERLLGTGLRRYRRLRFSTAKRRATMKPSLEILETRLTPSNYVVTDNGNGAGSAGDVTLRYAVANAGNGGTITFANSMTISLNGTTLTIANNETIENTLGAAAPVAISGSNSIPVFDISGGETVTISSLTVENGRVNGNGGGIINSGTLTLNNDTISNNTQTGASSGGGIYNTGNLTLTYCTVTGNSAVYGGGFANVGVMTVTNTTVSGNTAALSAGGLLNYGGTLTVSNSTVSGNSVPVSNATGGGVVNYSFNANVAQMTLSNDTIYGNSAQQGGGLENFSGTVTLSNDSVAGNYGGFAGGGIAIVGGSTMTMLNTIVAGNTGATQSPDITGFGGPTGTITVENYSLIGNTHGWTTASAGTGNLSNYPSAAAAGLSTLANNGGPTQTVALLPTSPAINAGGSAYYLPTDQRGIGRPNPPDIGAFQLEAITANTASLPANAANLTINGSAFDTNAANDGVTFSNGVTGSVSSATSTTLTVSLTGLSSVAGGTALTAVATVDGASSGSAVQVATVAPVVTLSTTNVGDSSSTITINGAGFSTTPSSNTVTFTSLGVAGSVTSATANQLTVTISTPPTALGSLTAVVTTGGSSNGAAVQVATEVNGTWTVTDPNGSTGSGSMTDVTLPYAVSNYLSGDTINFAGGLSGDTITMSSVLTIGANVTITGLGAANLAVSGNLAHRVFVVNSGVTASISSLTIENGKFTSGSGGGIYNDGTLALSNDTISGNSQSGAGTFSSGGGIFNASTLTLSNSTVTGNSAQYGGGFANVGVMTVTNTTIANNLAQLSAGGLLNYGGTLTVSNSTVSGNSVPISNATGGGGVNYNFNANVGRMTLNNDTIYGNSAQQGGGLENFSGTVTLSNDTVAGNYGGFQAGGISIVGGSTMTMQNTIVAGNTGATQNPDIGGAGGPTGTITVANYSLIGNTHGWAIAGGANNLTGVSAGLASSLANNGGPTQTVALLPTSVAINSGGGSYLATDQRGISRGNAPDIGAFELETITASTASLPVTATTLTIAGNAFDTNAANDSVTLSNGVTGSVTSATSTSLTVSLSGLSSVTGGTALTANATVDGVSSGSAVQVATAAPVVTASSANLPVSAASLTIAGYGFDTNAANDSVTFDNGVTGSVSSATSTSLTVSLTGLSSVSDGTTLHANATVDGTSSGSAVQVATVAPVVTASSANLPVTATTLTIAGFGFDTNSVNDSVTFDNGVTGTVASATGTSLTIGLTGLSSLTGGTALHANATVDGISSGSAVQVATVAPVVTASSANLPASATTLTIAGFGFDTNAANDSVTLSNGVTGSVSSATSTSLTVSLIGLSSVAGGTALTAIATVDGASSGSAVQVATVIPVVTANSATVADSSATITINGAGFSTTPSSNTVTFTSLGVVGSVTSATATQLTVAISTPPTALGSLTAVVTTGGISNGAAVQVATEVNGTWTVTDPNGTTGSGSMTDVTLPYAASHYLSADTINFAGGLSGDTITMSSVLTIGANVTITGLGAANLAVSGNLAHRVFVVNAGVTASISSLTIENGKYTSGSGGGIYNDGTLALSNDAISGNTQSGAGTFSSGGGIFNASTLTLSNSTVSGNSAVYGGGFANAGVMTVTNTTISNNTAALSAGGFENYGGTLTVSSSTVSGNSVPISNATGGGGVNYNFNANVAQTTLTNDTIYGNSAQQGGGLENFSGTITLSNDTISGNYGGFAGGGIAIVGGSTMTMLNTIVAGNTGATQSPDITGFGGPTGTITVENYSLIGNTHGWTTASAGTGDLSNYPSAAAAGLSTLANNGGPTQTVALLPGSPAISTGEALADITTDQRGFTRPTPPDMGAFQLGPTVTGSTANLPANATTLTIAGSGFDTVTANDSMTLSNGVTGSVTSATGFSLTVSLTGLSSLTGGTALTANATTDGQSSGSAVQVATVAPVVTASSANLPVTATTLTIAGFGFDTNSVNDSVTFDNGVTGTVASATGTSLTIGLTGLSSLTGGTALHANATVDGISSGSAVQVATVAPVVTASSANLPASATTLTIAGFGFDTNAANDSVTLSNGVTGSVSSATSTSLTVSLIGLSSVAGGTALTAIATVDGASSGSAVQVATVIPVVTANSATVADSSATITINGAGFSTTPSSNTVTFTSLGVVGSVTSATATQLTVAISTPPTALGSLTAVVTTGGISNGAAVQVATEVNGTWTVTDPNGTTGSGSMTDVTLPYAASHYLSADTINFAGGLSGDTITMSSVLTIGANVTITGLGAANLAVSGNLAHRVFVVNAGVTASISSLTIENGKYTSGSGGGIYNDGTLALSNDAISGNTQSGAGTFSSGGGIFNASTLTLSNSTVSGNSAVYGGGFANAGVMTVTNTTISNNTAALSAGGFENYGGTLTVSSSTVSGNSVPISNATGGGGVNYNFNANVAQTTLTNDTIYGNSAQQGGGLENFSGTITLSNDTISGNYGGFAGGGIAIVGGSTMTMLNTIVAGNTGATQSPDITGFGGPTGTITVENYSLIGNTHGWTTASAGTGDLSNYPSAAAAGLSTLANNGGPTQTVALLPGSPAISTGEALAGVTTDQRGFTRPTPPDMGAFQLAPTVTGSTANLPANATTLTIAGSGFDTVTANDSVTLSNGVTGSVSSATGFSLTVSLTGLSNVTGGTALTANVTTDGQSSGSAVQVATVAPVVTSSTASLLNNATSMTINGYGFDTTAAHDIVAFNDGVTGTVSSATGTSLTVSLTGLTGVAGGTPLDATATVDGTSSGSMVQVATVQNATVTTTTSLTDNGPNPSYGQAVNYTVTTTGVPNGATVYLEDASNSNVTVGSVVVSGGSENTSVSGLSIGTHEIFAVYSGAAGFTSSQSGQVLQTVNAPIAITSVAVNSDFAPVVDMSESGHTVTITTDGNNGFSAGNQVVIAGETGTSAPYNGSWTVLSASGDTFTYADTTASLPAVSFNSSGYAISANSSSALLGTQRSMVDSVAYTFNTAVNVNPGAITLGNLTPTTSGPATPATTAANMSWTSLGGGTTWVATFSSTAGNTVSGHSIADGVYTLTLNNADVTAVTDGAAMIGTRAVDTFYRLYGDVLGHMNVNANDAMAFNNTYLLQTGQANYLASLDYLGNGRVNANDLTPFNSRYLSNWSGFTPTI